MRVFITGGTGFVGSRVVELLRDTPHELRCLVRDPKKARAVREAGADMIVGDLTDKVSLLEGMRGCDWVASIANLLEFWVPDRSVYKKVNVDGTRNVLEAALETGISKVVHVSTVAVYGDAEWPISEDSIPGPKVVGEYMRSKRAGEEVAWELYETRELPLIMVYPGGVIGPQDPKAAGRYIRDVVNGAMPAQVVTRSVFPWVHVRDVASGIVKALEKDGNIGERYFLVAENLTFGEINKTVAEISGVKLPRLTMPDWMAVLSARCATAIADLSKKPPMLDMAADQIRLMKQGFEADGSKASSELGPAYTPIRVALEEAVASPPAGA
jgi:dihydroflavonol-4-reductase